MVGAIELAGLIILCIFACVSVVMRGMLLWVDGFSCGAMILEMME